MSDQIKQGCEPSECGTKPACAGCSHNHNQQPEEKKGGIALANVNNRIHLIFGDEYGMHVYSMAECGTDVEISIPVVTRLEQKEEYV